MFVCLQSTDCMYLCSFYACLPLYMCRLLDRCYSVLIFVLLFFTVYALCIIEEDTQILFSCAESWSCWRTAARSISSYLNCWYSHPRTPLRPTLPVTPPLGGPPRTCPIACCLLTLSPGRRGWKPCGSAQQSFGTSWEWRTLRGLSFLQALCLLMKLERPKGRREWRRLSDRWGLCSNRMGVIVILLGIIIRDVSIYCLLWCIVLLFTKMWRDTYVLLKTVGLLVCRAWRCGQVLWRAVYLAGLSSMGPFFFEMGYNCLGFERQWLLFQKMLACAWICPSASCQYKL